MAEIFKLWNFKFRGGVTRSPGPLDFHNLKERTALSITTAIEKKTKRKKKNKYILYSVVMMAKEYPSPSSLY